MDAFRQSDFLYLQVVRARARHDALADLVSLQLERRFGALTPAVRGRLAAASVHELMMWGEELVDAASMDEVFDG